MRDALRPGALLSRLRARRLPASQRRALRATVDRGYYLQANPDVAEAGADPLYHFHRHGTIEARAPSSLFSPHYVFSHEDQVSLAGQTAQQAYLTGTMHERTRVIFVSHDASRTGAPAIILRLIELFSACRDVECFTLLDQSGERLEEFQAVSHCHVMSRSRFDRDFSAADSDAEIAAFFADTGIFADNRPVVAVVNSMESSAIARGLAKCGVPVVSLIHEFADYYAEDRVREMFALSARIIFPSLIVNRVALQVPGVERDRAMVLGQGLLDDGFGGLDRASCRAQLRQDLGLPDDAMIVLNVGTQCIRKGIDLFAETAAQFAQRFKDRPEVHFVWFGARADHPDEAWHRADALIRAHGLEGRVHLNPSTSQIEQVFTGSDLFFLSARADPFPCVVHEAMACGLPVILFEDGAGSQELIVDGWNGTVVPMADAVAAADAIGQMAQDRANWAARAPEIVESIRRDWRFEDYFLTLRNVLRDHSGRADLASLRTAVPVTHREVLFSGCSDMFSQIEAGLRPDDLITIFAGHYREDVAGVVQRLGEIGLRHRIVHPLADTTEAQRALVHEVLRRSHAHSLVIHAEPDLLDPARLALLKIPFDLNPSIQKVI